MSEFKIGSSKDIKPVLIEAVVVGAGLLVLHEVIKMLFGMAKLNLGGMIQPYLQLFLAGFLFHIIAEYSGVNGWYVANYENPEYGF